MKKTRPRVPVGLLIAAVIVFILGAAAGPVIGSLATEKQMATNVLLSAIPFVLIFVGIVLCFITLVAFLASLLNHNISPAVYRPIELSLIGGIVLGVIGMFQPWWFGGFRLGFFVLLISTLSFILWSHIIPRGVQHHAGLGSLSISEFEQSESGNKP